MALLTYEQYVREQKEASRRIDEKMFLHASLQLNIPGPIAKRMEQYDNEVVEPADRTDSDISHPHISVLTGITTSDADEVAYYIETFGKPIHVTLGPISLFEPHTTQYHQQVHEVVKIEVFSDDLMDLHERVRENVESAHDFPDYAPHVTLAYVRPGRGKKYAGDNRFSGLHITFNEVVFSDRFNRRTRIPTK